MDSTTARDEIAGRVLDRLRRIRELRDGELRTTVPPSLLGELRELVVEAEAWAKLEGDERARAAVAFLDEALCEVEEVTPDVLLTR